MAAPPQSLHDSEREEAATDEEAAITDDAAVDDTAAVPIPGDDDAKATTDDATGELESPAAIVIAVPAKPVVGACTLEDRSKYHGEIDTLGEPHGAGVLDSCFGSKYAGEFRDGKKHGHGGQVYINGSTYAGEFAEDQPIGYGVHTSPFAEKHLGQRAETARQGIGLCIESNAEIVFGQFADNERDEAANVPWESVQEHTQRALVAERRALRIQEAARELHLEAVFEELSAVDTTSFQDAEQTAQFEAQEQLELQRFVKEQNEIVAEVERIADVHKFKEAELKQHQKLLRVEIDTKSKELSFVAKFCSLATERNAQVEDAERTLHMLQAQLHMLVQLQQQPAVQDEASGSALKRGESHSEDQAAAATTMEEEEAATAMVADATKKERVAVLSMNIFARPEGIHSGKWFSNGDFKDLRVSLLLRKIRDFDIVILQEMFEVGVRQKRLIREARSMGFKYHCGSVWMLTFNDLCLIDLLQPSLTDRYLIDGGLLILSRFPIVERGQHAYTQGSGSDGICSKGVLYARVQLSPDLGDSLHVFTTHTQAGDRIKEYSIRAAQLKEMQSFITRTIRDDREAPVLITGDFNLDARHNLAHDPKSIFPVSTLCHESEVYKQLVRDLEKALGSGRRVIDLMKLHDSTKVGDAVHPITNGDGHSSLVHTSDPYSLDKDGKCIDYMFFSPSSRERRTSVGDTPNFQLRIVESRTTVDHCDVAPLVDNQPLPITHLSDHYGLRAEFELEITPVAHPNGTPVHHSTPLYELLQLYFPQRAFAQAPQRLWMWKLIVGLLTIAGATITVVNVVGRVLHSSVGLA